MKVGPHTQSGAAMEATAPVRELTRKDLDRQRLRDRLLTGAASPRTGKAVAAYFDQLRGRVREAGPR